MTNLTYNKLYERALFALRLQCEPPNIMADPEAEAKVVLDVIWPEIEKRDAMLRRIVLMMNDDWEDVPHEIEEILNG